MLTYLQTSNEKFATFVSYFIWISDETFKYFLRFWSLYNNFGWWNTLLITFYYFCERVHFFIALMTTNYLSTPHPLTTGILVFFFFNLSSNCSNLFNMRNLQEQVKNVFCYQKLFWPFTVRINCLKDLKKIANFSLKSFSWSLEYFFLTVGQNYFVNKICTISYFWHIFLF